MKCKLKNLFSVVDEDAVEKLVLDPNLSEPHIENLLDSLTLDVPISNPKKTVTDDPTLNTLGYTTGNLPDSSIIWSNPQVFIKPVYIAKFHSGTSFQILNNHLKINSFI